MEGIGVGDWGVGEGAFGVHVYGVDAEAVDPFCKPEIDGGGVDCVAGCRVFEIQVGLLGAEYFKEGGSAVVLCCR